MCMYVKVVGLIAVNLGKSSPPSSASLIVYFHLGVFTRFRMNRSIHSLPFVSRKFLFRRSVCIRDLCVSLHMCLRSDSTVVIRDLSSSFGEFARDGVASRVHRSVICFLTSDHSSNPRFAARLTHIHFSGSNVSRLFCIFPLQLLSHE